MSKTYTKASDEVMALVYEARDRNGWHRVLSSLGVTFDVLMVEDVDDEGESHPALKHHGYPAAAIIKINSLEQRTLGQADALLTIDACSWSELDEEGRLALLDHELEHLQVLAEKPVGIMYTNEFGALQGIVRRDECGRPRLKMKLHDWQLGGFRAVAQRHKEKALEIVAVRACMVKGQYYWDFDAPKRKKGEPAALAAAAE